jgi:hypothetical protein
MALSDPSIFHTAPGAAGHAVCGAFDSAEPGAALLMIGQLSRQPPALMQLPGAGVRRAASCAAPAGGKGVHRYPWLLA